MKPICAPSTSAVLLDSALIGAGAGMRSVMPFAILAARGRLLPAPLRPLLYLAAAGEVVSDKHPATPSRSSAPLLAERLVTGALAGAVVGGPAGAALAGAVAVGVSYVAPKLRAAGAAALEVPDAVLASVEDGLAVAVSAVATRRQGA